MKWKIMIISGTGTVKHKLMGGLTKEEAFELCENMEWEYLDENDYLWDLEIEQYED